MQKRRLSAAGYLKHLDAKNVGNIISPDGTFAFSYGLGDYVRDGAGFLSNQSASVISRNTGWSEDVIHDAFDGIALVVSFVGPGKARAATAVENAAVKVGGRVFTAEFYKDFGWGTKAAEQAGKRIDEAVKIAESKSTVRLGQSANPRDLVEEILWNHVEEYPGKGTVMDLAGGARDPSFKPADGFIKMRADAELPGTEKNVDLHYQYKKYTGKTYDMEIASNKRIKR